MWPLLLIFFGLSLLMGRGARPEPVEDSLSLDGATSAAINFKHGAGVLAVRAGAGPERLYDGVFTGGLNKRIDRQGGRQAVRVCHGRSGSKRHGGPRLGKLARDPLETRR